MSLVTNQILQISHYDSKFAKLKVNQLQTKQSKPQEAHLTSAQLLLSVLRSLLSAGTVSITIYALLWGGCLQLHYTMKVWLNWLYYIVDILRSQGWQNLSAKSNALPVQDEVSYISIAFICLSGKEPVNTFEKGRPLMRQACFYFWSIH